MIRCEKGKDNNGLDIRLLLGPIQELFLTIRRGNKIALFLQSKSPLDDGTNHTSGLYINNLNFISL